MWFWSDQTIQESVKDNSDKNDFWPDTFFQVK